MGMVRIYDLAITFRLTTKEVLDRLHAGGVSTLTLNSTVDEERAREILLQPAARIPAHAIRPSTGAANAKTLPREMGGFISADVANELERTQLTTRYHTKGGTGFAAEDANAFADRIRLRHVEITGTGNEANGPDRIVDGTAIQTKYYPTATATIKSAFELDSGLFRYQDQMLEVPSDQYDECVKLFREKIAQGKVPGVTNPDEADRIVKKGTVTYRQARNIARAGNIDSLLYDAKTQAVTSAYVFAISFAVDFARRKWNGEETGDAVKNAVASGVVAGTASLITGVIAAQVLRTRAAAIGVVVVRDGVKTVSTTALGRAAIQKLATASLGKAVYGAAAMNHVSKLLRSNVITSTITTVVITAPDFYRAALAGSISWSQLSKNLVANISGVAAGAGGWVGGTAAGAAIGSIIPVIGTVAGGVVGGIIGAFAVGTAGSIAGKAIMDRFIEDDAKRMVQFVQEIVEELACDYLLSERETKEFATMVKTTLIAPWLREMYQAGSVNNSDYDRRQFASKCFDEVCRRIVGNRPTVSPPPTQEVEETLREFATIAGGQLSYAQ
jgi:hypothetical protein